MAQEIKTYVQAEVKPHSEVKQDAPQAAEPKEYAPLAEGAQYVEAAAPKTLVEILPAQYASTRPPLIYRLSKVSEPSRAEGRIAESRVYRAKAFSCGFFYKPISRCVVDWEDKDK